MRDELKAIEGWKISGPPRRSLDHLGGLLRKVSTFLDSKENPIARRLGMEIDYKG
jgi:hypothetical protein